jgi:AcrR family transcriptional regulator
LRAAPGGVKKEEEMAMAEPKKREQKGQKGQTKRASRASRAPVVSENHPTRPSAGTFPNAAPSTDSVLWASLQAQAPDVQQDRAKRSYQAMLDAAEKLFSRDGYDGAGTPEIAEEAGVSVGTVYRYFTDKKAIFLEVLRRYLLQAYHETLDGLTPERFVGKARHETLDETVGILFAYVSRNPRLNRVFVEMSLRDDEISKLREGFEAAACQRLAQLIGAICPREVIPDPEATAWVLHAAGLECAIGLSGAGRSPPLAAARARKALTMMIARMLFPEG